MAGVIYSASILLLLVYTVGGFHYNPVAHSNYCPALLDVDNGVIKYEYVRPEGGNTAAGNVVATYSCNDGYSLIGESTLTCLSNEVWSSTLPLCARLCPPLPAINNGALSYNPFNSSKFYSQINTTATYTCNEGYLMIGESSSHCLSDGTWSSTPPMCIDPPPVYVSNSYDIIYTSNNSEILITDFTYLNCHTDLRNCCRYSDGSTGLGEWFYPNGRFVPARIYSESFYRSRNAPQVVRLGRHFTDTATDTGLYCCVIPTTIGEQRFCVHLVSCLSLPPLLNGMITYNPPGENTVATYSCNDGYLLIGRDTRTCQPDKTWSYIAPYCADSAMVQLKFAPTEHCILWNDNKASTTSSLMRGAIQEAILAKGNITIPLENIDEGCFSCYSYQNQTTYRTKIIGTETASAVKGSDYIQKWVESGVAVKLGWYLVYIDKNCPVSISSLSEPECRQVTCDICIMRGRK